MLNRSFTTALGAVALSALTACATSPGYGNRYGSPAPAPVQPAGPPMFAGTRTAPGCRVNRPCTPMCAFGTRFGQPV